MELILIISDTHKFVYIDVPKTGSVSLSNFFIKHYNGYLGEEGLYPESWGYHNRVIPEYAKNYRVIASVRNPYTRLVSAYYHDVLYPKEHSATGSMSDYLDFNIDLLKLDNDVPEFYYYRNFPQWKYLFPIKCDVYIHTEDLKFELYKAGFDTTNLLKEHTNSHPRWEDTCSEVLKRKIWTFAGPDFELYGYKT